MYGVIHWDERDTSQFLSVSQDFLGAHPRQDADSLGAIRQLKLGKDYYYWVFLQGNPKAPEEDDRVTVGVYHDGDGDDDWR